MLGAVDTLSVLHSLRQAVLPITVCRVSFRRESLGGSN